MITLLYQAMIPSNFGVFSTLSDKSLEYQLLPKPDQFLNVFKATQDLADLLFCSISSLKIQGVTNCLAFSWSGNYCMRAIITRGLYTCFPLLEVQKYFFKWLFS